MTTGRTRFARSSTKCTPPTDGAAILREVQISDPVRRVAQRGSTYVAATDPTSSLGLRKSSPEPSRLAPTADAGANMEAAICGQMRSGKSPGWGSEPGMAR